MLRHWQGRGCKKRGEGKGRQTRSSREDKREAMGFDKQLPHTRVYLWPLFVFGINHVCRPPLPGHEELNVAAYKHPSRGS